MTPSIASIAVGKTTFGTVPGRSSGADGREQRLGGPREHARRVLGVEQQRARLVVDVLLLVGSAPARP